MIPKPIKPDPAKVLSDLYLAAMPANAAYNVTHQLSILSDALIQARRDATEDGFKDGMGAGVAFAILIGIFCALVYLVATH